MICEHIAVQIYNSKFGTSKYYENKVHASDST